MSKVARPASLVPLHELSDEELARLCSEEIAGCIDELVRRYEQRVRDCARRMALDPESAEDAVQEVFLRLLVSVQRFSGRSAFATWMFRLAHNTCIDVFRRDVRHRDRRSPLAAVTQEVASGSWGDPEAALDSMIRECYVGWLLGQLPPAHREVVRLRITEGRTTEEVARLLGTSEDAVKSKLRRARSRLRELLIAGRTCPFCGDVGALRISRTGDLT
jgi:RNA polymerase sigma-70 factor (ECF subfamily)